MFLSVAGIDVAGNTLVATGHPDLGHAIHVFAADWRHGLNGHSPLFMPGFFVLTPAAWYWSGKQSVAQLLRGGATALLVGLLLASLAAPIGTAAAANAFSCIEIASAAPITAPTVDKLTIRVLRVKPDVGGRAVTE